ncbi:MAG: DUF2608 domain-containing protein, partial [Endozoicomonas sp.]
DTAITTPEGQWLGNSAMFYDQLAKQKEIHPGLNKGELSAMIDPLLEAVYLRVPVQLTDQSLPRTLRKLQHKGVTVIGMTARGDSIRQVTLKQLKQVGLAFSDLGKHRTLKLDGARTVHIEQGVVFVSHGNSKGETLIRLLKDGGGGAPDQVILIDDRQQHLTDVAAALSSSLPAIHYYPVFCDFPQKRPSFNREAAEVQLFHFLVKYQKDSPVNQLIQQDNFTRDFIRRCPDIQPGERCKKLLFRVQGSPFSGS